MEPSHRRKRNWQAAWAWASAGPKAGGQACLETKRRPPQKVWQEKLRLRPGREEVSRSLIYEVIELLRCRFCRPCLQRSGRYFAVRPHGAVLEILLLPDRDRALESVDSEPASIESSWPMGRTDGDEHTGFPDFEAPQSMRNCEEVNRKSFVDLRGDFADFSQRHGFVSFVVKIKCPPAL